MRRPLMGTLFFLLLVAVRLGAAGASETARPIWPLNIEISASASFGEYRGGRLHTGIDMRTRGSTGWPVVAVEDGFVARIKVERRGFGNALYIDHPGLQTRVVYGHLEHFAPALDAWVAEQRRVHHRRYGYDEQFSPARFPVKKGEVVGFSGETGVGPAHLHFETRTFADEPFAPSTKGWVPPDDRPAEAIGVHFIPLAEGATIDGQFLPVHLPLKHAGSATWQTSRSVRLTGRVGILAGMVDMSEAGNRFGVEVSRLLVDGKEAFMRRFDRISYTTNKQCPLVYDLPLSEQPGTGYVYTMFRWPWETLPMTCTRTPWAGTSESWPVGPHAVTVAAVDFGGRPLRIEIPVVVASAAPRQTALAEGQMTVLEHRATPAGLVVVARVNSSPKADVVHCSDARGELTDVPVAKVGADQIQVFFGLDARWQGGATVGSVPILPPGLTLIGPAGGRVTSIASDGPVAVFPAGSLFQPTWCYWEPRADLPGNAKLPARSRGWRLHPDTLVSDKAFSVTIPCTPIDSMKRLGIYSRNHSGGFGFEGDDVKGPDRLGTDCRWTGPMIVLEDTVPPGIKPVANGQFPLFGKCWRFTVTDVGKGIDDEAFKVQVDGKAADWEFDPDHAMLYVAMAGAKGPGKHRLEVAAMDRAGLSSYVVVQR